MMMMCIVHKGTGINKMMEIEAQHCGCRGNIYGHVYVNVNVMRTCT
jgi:hypothetical protein